MFGPKVSGVLAAAALAIGVLALGASPVDAAKGGNGGGKGITSSTTDTKIQLSWSPGEPHWVMYSLDRASGGSEDLAVYETCTESGLVVYQEARRLFYDDSAGKHGTSQVWIAGDHCTAYIAVIGVPGAVSNTVSFSTSGLY